MLSWSVSLVLACTLFILYLFFLSDYCFQGVLVSACWRLYKFGSFLCVLSCSPQTEQYVSLAMFFFLLNSHLSYWFARWLFSPSSAPSVDCGIFAVKFMELWDKDIDLRNVFDQSDIPNIRVKLANNMFFSRANTINKSLVINLCQQVLVPS